MRRDENLENTTINPILCVCLCLCLYVASDSN